MSLINVDIVGIGTVTIQKRRGTRSLRLRILPNGEVRISMPLWLPKQAAIDFAKDRTEWIAKHRKPAKIWRGGEAIGKKHQLRFAPDSVSRCRSVIGAQTISVTYPENLSIDSSVVQAAAKRAIAKALIGEASWLEQRLEMLAAQYRLPYRSVSFRFMRSKWGHCDAQRNILLNYQLLSIPDHLIDYVLLHELTHTKHMNHSAEFWQALTALLPNTTNLRRELRRYNSA